MLSLVKFAKKFLMSEPFFIDGFEYQFVSVEELFLLDNAFIKFPELSFV